jgi:pyrimidine-nucleoside phosphorylase
MRIYDIILKKRNGLENSKEEIEQIIQGYVNGEVPDYQMSAWLMAVYFRHLTARERFFLTDCMLNSGNRIDLSSIRGTKIDKHSTGGVGDKVTLVVGPIVASCGLVFAKLSGRGLGHTGGTIDKLESISGFRTSMEIDAFEEQADRIGIALAGQTTEVATADKKLYSLRDVTATVDEISLIASSIMSKKLAISTDGILLDVKTGSGAFMKNLDDARALALAMVDIGRSYDRKTGAVISNMDQPLGRAVGNALEVREAIETLAGRGPEDFDYLCRVISERMLIIGGVASEENAGRIVAKAISSGSALARFDQFVEAQGGPASLSKTFEASLPRAAIVREVVSETEGYVQSIDAEGVGLVCMRLGAGRERKEDAVDPAVGVEVIKKIGDHVAKGEILAIVHGNSEESVEKANRSLLESFFLSELQIEPPPTIHEIF